VQSTQDIHLHLGVVCIHCMSTSPKLSDWFYLFEQRNCRLAPRTVRPPEQAPAAPPAKPRGVAAGSPRKVLTEPQRQTIIDLLQQHPRSPSTVREKFAEAWPGLTVTSVSIHTIKHKAIKTGKLQL
jgi:hypothetical protein